MTSGLLVRDILSFNDIRCCVVLGKRCSHECAALKHEIVKPHTANTCSQSRRNAIEGGLQKIDGYIEGACTKMPIRCVERAIGRVDQFVIH